MTAWLVQIDAATLAGAAATVRVTTHNDVAVTSLDGQTWWPAVQRLPVLRFDFFDGDFSAQITAPTGEIVIRDLAGVAGARDDMALLRWASSRVRIWRGAVGAAFGAFSLTFDGRVTAQPTIDDGALTLPIAVDDRWLDQPLLPTYAGTGGVEGPDAMAGQPKPLLLGAPRYAPGVLIDADDLVWQLSHAGVRAVPMAFDRLARFGAATGDFATLAALRAAAIPVGGWATCLALGLVRHGAPHDGQACWHVEGDDAGTGGWVRRPGAIIGRIVALAGGSAHSASLSALDTARPYDLSLALTEQTTARTVIQTIAASVGAVAGIGMTGQMWARPVTIGTPAATLRSDGTAMPPVASVRRIALAAPFWRLATQAVITQVVHDISTVAFDYIYRGPFNIDRVYRPDDAVTTDDGSMWRFVGATPLAGSVPSDVNPNWSRDLDAIAGSGPPGADGADGADGDDGFTISPASQAFTIAAFAGGTPKSGEFNKVITFAVRQGTTDLSNDGSTTYEAGSLTGIASGWGWSGTNNKVLTITGMTADAASLTVTIKRAGTAIATVPVTLTKVRDGFGSIAQSDTTLTINNSGSYSGDQGGPITLSVGPGGTVRLSVDHNYSIASGLRTYLAGKFQYRTTPGSGGWTDIGSEVADSFGAAVSEPSVLSFSDSISGPGSATNWEFRYVNRRSSGSATMATDSGTFTVEWSGA